MSKTITVSDAFWTELVMLVNGGPIIVAPPADIPPAVPVGVKVVDLPFATTVGTKSVRIPLGGSVAIRFQVPVGYNSNKQYSRITESPTGGLDYFARIVCISELPGDFAGPGLQKAVQDSHNIPFTVGGAPLDPYGRPITRYLDLIAGKTYFMNVKQQDPHQDCSFNYSLTTA